MCSLASLLTAQKILRPHVLHITSFYLFTILFIIELSSWESIAEKRPEWRHLVHEKVYEFEDEARRV